MAKTRKPHDAEPQDAAQVSVSPFEGDGAEVLPPEIPDTAAGMRASDLPPEAEKTPPAGQDLDVMTTPDVSQEPAVPFQGPPSDMPASAPQTVIKRGGFLSAFLGGAAALAVGFGASHYNLLELQPDMSSEASRLSEADITAEINKMQTALQGEIEALKSAQQSGEGGAAAAQSQLAALAQQVEKLQQDLALQRDISPDGAVNTAAFAALSSRVEDLAAQQSMLAQNTGAVRMDEAALQALFDQQFAARAADMAAQAERDAEALRKDLRADQAKAALATALREGQAFASLLPDLGAQPVAPVLSAYADQGVIGRARLQENFAPAARSALEAALRVDQGTGFGDRLWSFLRIGVGARSLTPQEGNDPDAILSRAEAALGAGDLSAALAQIAALPPEAQAAMADWVATAKIQLEAEAALAALAK